MVLVRVNLSTDMVPWDATIIEANILNPKGGIDHRFHKVKFKDGYEHTAHERYMIPYLDYNNILKDIL